MDLGNKKTIIKPFEVIGSIFLSYLIFICLILVFNQANSNRVTSFIIVNISAIAGILFLNFRLKTHLGFSLIRILFIGYAIKLIIGYLFWEFYIFPGYLLDPGSKMFFAHREYLATYDLMRNLAEYRIKNGIFTFPIEYLYYKHVFLHFIMSNLYLSGGFHTLDIAIQNILFSLYTAVIISFFVKLMAGNIKQVKWALLLAVYQPFSMISTIIWRDNVGQFFVVLGVFMVFVVVNKKYNINTIITLLVASILMYIQRLYYAFFPILIVIVNSFLSKKRRFQSIIIVPFVLFFIYFNSAFLEVDDSQEVYGANISGVKLWLFLPINLVRLFIGPFPWTNWFNFDDASILLIADYLQVVINGTYVYFVIMFYNNRKYRKNAYVNNSFFLVAFLLFMFSALGTKQIHVAYMSMGAVFLIPIVVQIAGTVRFQKTLLTIFMGFIILNVLAILGGISGHGYGGMFR